MSSICYGFMSLNHTMCQPMLFMGYLWHPIRGTGPIYSPSEAFPIQPPHFKPHIQPKPLFLGSSGDPKKTENSENPR